MSSKKTSAAPDTPSLMTKRRQSNLLSSNDEILRADLSKDETPAAKRAKTGKKGSSSVSDSSAAGVGSSSSTGLNLSKAMVTLDELSCPPTKEELDNYVDLDPRELPAAYKRDHESRVFVNRDLRMDKIQMFGFDMDYTLAVYKSPAYEEMVYNFVKDRLIGLGYPESMADLRYDPSFPIRGLWIDKELGNLLKVGKYGNLITGFHGRRQIPKKQLVELYPAMHVTMEIGNRFAVLDTLFSLPESCLFADIVERLEKGEEARDVSQTARRMQEQDGKSAAAAAASAAATAAAAANKSPMKRTPSGVDLNSRQDPDLGLSFQNLHKDVRTATDWVHQSGVLKKETLANLEKYVYRDPERLSTLLHRMRTVAKARVFLLTNSEWYYTNDVMAYLLDGARADYPCWRDYFDIVITSAQKPSFFEQGSTFREVDVTTGNLKIGRKHAGFKKDAVYCGGSLEHFAKNTGVTGQRVLYIGDHIFSDLMKSKKTTFWRTLLVMPEVSHEVSLARRAKPLQDHLLNISFIRSEVYRGLDSNTQEPPDCDELHKQVKKSVHDLNRIYNEYWGSPFRSGFQETFFAMQVERFADLYSGDFLNLLNYPFFYRFSSDLQSKFLPHEYIRN